MNTQQLERAIVKSQATLNERTGHLMIEYGDVRSKLVEFGLAQVEADKLTNTMLGRLVMRLGGFTVGRCEQGGDRRSNIQCDAARLKRLRDQVAQYVTKPSKGHHGPGMPGPRFPGYKTKARF
jgi:hypothetical protein